MKIKPCQERRILIFSHNQTLEILETPDGLNIFLVDGKAEFLFKPKSENAVEIVLKENKK